LRYFIHIFNGSQLIAHPDGGDFPDLAAAAAEGAQSARDLVAEELRVGRPFPMRWEVHIAGPDGAVLEAVPFTSLLATEDDLEPEPTVEAQPRARRPECGLEAIYAREG